MFPLAPAVLAAHSRSAAAGRKPKSPKKLARTPGAKPSGTHRALRLVVALAGSLVLVVALVDPLRGNDGFDVQVKTQDQGVRHE